MAPRQIERVDDKAEGDIIVDGVALPYNTELASINGVWFHVWIGVRSLTAEQLEAFEMLARRTRDVVRFTWSDGEPSSYWAHQAIVARIPLERPAAAPLTICRSCRASIFPDQERALCLRCYEELRAEYFFTTP